MALARRSIVLFSSLHLLPSVTVYAGLACQEVDFYHMRVGAAWSITCCSKI